MHWKEHSKKSMEKIGKQYEMVHIWLDEFAKSYWPSKFHRAHRHHMDGVEEARKKWGDEAAESAKLHILDDMQDMNIAFIPPNEKWWDDLIYRYNQMDCPP